MCPYYTMFPLDFPFKSLGRAKRNEWVIDPFCGRGTTNFAARLRGLPSLGIDTNPVAVAIAAAKFSWVTPQEIAVLCKTILDMSNTPTDVPSGAFWELCFSPKTLIDICKLREYLLINCSTSSEIALSALVIGILHGPKLKGLPTYLSNQMPRTYATKPDGAVNYWLKKKLKPDPVDVLDAVTRRAFFVFADLPPVSEGRILQTDSRNDFKHLVTEPCKWVVTSPPYYGMRSYYPDQWLRNWFLGGPSTVSYPRNGQLSHYSEQFVKDMATVWANVAEVCETGARLVVRFGALPSESNDPELLLKKSLAIANCGWKVTLVRDAGKAPKGRRQADQFVKRESLPVEEIDLYAVLER